MLTSASKNPVNFVCQDYISFCSRLKLFPRYS